MASAEGRTNQDARVTSVGGFGCAALTTTGRDYILARCVIARLYGLETVHYMALPRIVPTNIPPAIAIWYAKYNNTSRLVGDKYVNLDAMVNTIARALITITNALAAPRMGVIRSNTKLTTVTDMANTAKNPVPTPSSVNSASAKAPGSADSRSVDMRILSGDAKRGRLIIALAKNSANSVVANKMARRRTTPNLAETALPSIQP